MYSVFEEFPKGWGGGLKKYLENGKSWGVGGSYVKFPPWWGYGYFLELHNVCMKQYNDCFTQSQECSMQKHAERNINLR